MGWSTVTNGDLIRLAEEEGYELLITIDTNLRYQQNLRSRSIAILVLTTTSWPRIRQVTSEIEVLVAAIRAGDDSEPFLSCQAPDRSCMNHGHPTRTNPSCQGSGHRPVLRRPPRGAFQLG